MSDHSKSLELNLAERLVTRIQGASDLLNRVSVELREHSIELASVSTDLKNLRESVSEISKTLTGGNGNSIVTRVSILEEVAERLETAMDRVDTRCDKKHCALLEKATTDLMLKNNATGIEEKKLAESRRSTRLKFFATIGASLLALVGSVLALLLK
jgi:hypothetical protein